MDSCPILRQSVTRANFIFAAMVSLSGGILCGQTSRPTLPANYKTTFENADVLVMPSVNEEPAGLVIMEQMAQGKPVIVSDHGGGPELAGDKKVRPGIRHQVCQFIGGCARTR